MRIAVDAMGTDTCPDTDVVGTIQAAVANPNDTFLLIGPQSQVENAITNAGQYPHNLQVIHAADVITMQDKPATVGKQKPNSSMHIGMGLVRDSKANAFVTAGNTGAAQAIGMLFTLKRIPNVKRPALSAIFPIYDQPRIFLDVGANTDGRPEWLVQYGIMGKIYAENALHIQSPRIGLLSNGEEDSKGTPETQEAAEQLRNTPLNYVGYVEPLHILNGEVDVIVTDGFSGNIMIKTFEASTRYLSSVLRTEIARSPVTSAGGLLARPAFSRARDRMDTYRVGGAPLLGINGVVIVCHGSSPDYAIRNAINQAKQAVQGNVIGLITENLANISTQ